MPPAGLTYDSTDVLEVLRCQIDSSASPILLNHLPNAKREELLFLHKDATLLVQVMKKQKKMGVRTLTNADELAKEVETKMDVSTPTGADQSAKEEENEQKEQVKHFVQEIMADVFFNCA